MQEVVFLTGGTGFLGAQIALRLMKRKDARVIAFVRADDKPSAERRLRRAWWDWPELRAEVGVRVETVTGDLAAPNLGLDAETHARLVKEVTHIIHSAADMRLNGPIDELRRANVEGTKNIIELARAAHADHGITRYAHISTAYVAGGRRGEVPESDLTDEHGFSSRYELSKFEGEREVQAAKKELPISVFRPGMVIGDSKTGAIRNFNTLYFPLRLFLFGKLRTIPSKPGLKVNMVPVDYVADAVSTLTFKQEAEGLNFHLVAPYEKLPTAREMMNMARDYALKQHGIELKRPRFVPIGTFLTRSAYKTQKALEKQDKSIFDGLLTLAPYFSERRRFRRDNTDRLMGKYDFDWREVLPHMVEFAIFHGFMHRSERTVFEQIIFRQKSKTRPVTYHDIVDGKEVRRTGLEVRADILAAAEALRSMGIGPGDNVGISGVNSTRYVTVDTAIGLVGAVSVPIYYTSAPNEVDTILISTGCKMFFVGAPKLLERLGEIRSTIPMVSFCRACPALPEDKDVTTWQAFLDKGKGSKGPTTAPVNLDDLANIRCTSGTTGNVKGVTFKHHNLRAMAESLAAVLPWNARTRAIHYLSYLPMSHVVEGISAAYAPYYTPCSLDVWYLEDFRGLEKAVPTARPNIFFSVPRYYEKVWEKVMENSTARNWVSAPEGFKKNLLRGIIRKKTLEKAGLDRCEHLLVGSAPMSMECLENFRSLGIEIHDAYGLTEAPVVTMNMQGHNKLGTVGTLMPWTEMKISDDGEVLFKGPQITPGYYDPELEQPFVDGWFATGDLGHIDEDGYLVLKGRKREMMVTSYGKNIHPVKVEGMLRQLPGINEAMLIGEARPYVSALVWYEPGLSKDELKEMDGGIRAVNGFLSHAEQVKHWAILPFDLSVDGGELTPSLKLKRQAVLDSRAGVIEGLYDGKEKAGVLYGAMKKD